MSKPEPRIDEKGVPWCTGKCAAMMKMIGAGQYGCKISEMMTSPYNICKPQVKLDEAERERLAALVEKLRQDMHEAVEHCEVCRGLARASSRRCARCLTFIRRIETAAQKENDNGCTDTTG